MSRQNAYGAIGHEGPVAIRCLRLTALRMRYHAGGSALGGRVVAASSPA